MMDTLPVLLVAFLALYMVPLAFSLECYACTNQAELSGGSKCESDKAEKITCQPLYNRCMTMKYTISLGSLGSTSIELRNCSINAACDPNSQFNTCKLLNTTGMVTDCSLDCCEGDLCNTLAEQPTSLEPTSLEPTSLEPTSLEPTSLEPTSLEPTSLEPTSDAFGLVASFGAILFVFFLGVFA